MTSGTTGLSQRRKSPAMPATACTEPEPPVWPQHSVAGSASHSAVPLCLHTHTVSGLAGDHLIIASKPLRANLQSSSPQPTMYVFASSNAFSYILILIFPSLRSNNNNSSNTSAPGADIVCLMYLVHGFFGDAYLL